LVGLSNVRCAVCGKEIENGTLCGRCLAERCEIAKIEPFEIIQCSRCGFIRIGGRWRNISLEDAVKELVRRNVFITEEFEVHNIFINPDLSSLKISGRIREESVSVTIPVRYVLKKITCLRCSREAGGYYESIVQLRAEGRKLEQHEIERATEIINEFLAREVESEKSFLSKIEERKEGIDFYFGGRDTGRKISQRIAREMGGKVKKSRKIHGRVDGREVYRFTYLVRLPGYGNGDVVERDRRLYVVRNTRDGKGVDILTGKSANIEGSKVVARKKDIGSGTVVNVDDSVAEILTDEGVLVRTQKPAGISIGKRVKIFEFEGRYFSFPEDLG
jgi:nonsense-mediated mRNA decay protein 3